MNFFKSKKGNKFITECRSVIKDILNQLPSDAENIKVFSSNNGGIHSFQQHFFVTFKSKSVKVTKKASEWDGHNGRVASYIPKWKIEDAQAEKEKFESQFWKMAWEDGRF